MTLRIFQVPSPKHYAGRSGQAVVALVHHRMVGTLKSTDATFTTGTRQASTNFGVGYDCGRSGHPTGLAGAHVHQYVMVDDAAWGNGNLDATGEWDDVYGATPNPNFRTISIEHHDNGGAAAGSGKGVVPEEVIAVSIELDRLLLSGDWDAWRAAGTTANTAAGGAAVAAQVAMIRPSSSTLIDHHYISGRLKPYCWRPWADDPTGFPQARYLDELSTEDDVNLYAVKVQRWTAQPVHGVLRSEPVRTTAPFLTLPAGTEILSYAEYRSADGNNWRAGDWPAGSGTVVWFLRTGPGIPPDHDFIAGEILTVPCPPPDCTDAVNVARAEGDAAGASAVAKAAADEAVLHGG